MITAQERIEAMKGLMLAAREFTKWGELTPAKAAILEELEARVDHCLAGYAGDNNYNWLVWVRPRETVEEFVRGTHAAQVRAAEIRKIRERREVDRWHWARNGDAWWAWCENNPKRLVIAAKPGRILAMAEANHYNALLARHGDALASVLQVLRHR